MKWLLGTAFFLLISTACFAADNKDTPPVDMGGTPPMFGLPRPKPFDITQVVLVNIHNNYPFPITVDMDSKREEHPIASGGVATFRANKGDNPTFRAHKDGAVINSKNVFLDGDKTLNFP